MSYDGSPSGSDGTYSDVSGSSYTKYIATSGARNARDSVYFREGGSTDVGPSASQVGRDSGSVVASSPGRPLPLPSVPEASQPQVVLAKQTLLNEELRSEVDNLRRDLERIRMERVVDEAPPMYSDPV